MLGPSQPRRTIMHGGRRWSIYQSHLVRRLELRSDGRLGLLDRLAFRLELGPAGCYRSPTLRQLRLQQPGLCAQRRHTRASRAERANTTRGAARARGRYRNAERRFCLI
eukprot:scaffold28657_cov69-Phaeocystis_antarctica.AAC.1